MAFEKEYKEFTVIKINLNIVKNDSKKHFYNEDDLYLEFNNVEYNGIIWMNYIYDYCTFYLGPKATYNFFSKVMFRPIKKAYREKETRHWIFTTRTTMYRTFILSLEHSPIYMKKGAILEGC